MVWIKGSDERVHIYLYPSFVIKRCPFPTSTLEYIWETCITPGIEPFDLIKDPDNLLDSSVPLEHHTKKIYKFMGTSKYMIKWNHLYCKIFYSLSPEAEKALTDPYITSPERTYRLIRSFASGVLPNIPKHEYLSFANFQFPLK